MGGTLRDARVYIWRQRDLSFFIATSLQRGASRFGFAGLFTPS